MRQEGGNWLVAPARLACRAAWTGAAPHRAACARRVPARAAHNEQAEAARERFYFQVEEVLKWRPLK